MSKLKLVIGSDHAGCDYTKDLYNYLQRKNYEVLRIGAINCSEPYDYPDAAKQIAKLVKSKTYDYGILLCGSGIGVSIQANRYKGIRAALCSNKKISALSREHNDANILCLAARYMTLEAAIECIDTFLNTPFLHNEKYLRRIQKLDDL